MCEVSGGTGKGTDLFFTRGKMQKINLSPFLALFSLFSKTLLESVTVTSSMQRHLDTAGSLENSGAGEGNRTLVISLGNR